MMASAILHRLVLCGGLLLCVFPEAAPGHAGEEIQPEALTVAVEGNDLDKVRTLVAGGADLNQRSVNGMTPLHIAARRNRARIAEELLKAGADATLVDKKGMSPLLLASAFGQNQVVSVLVAIAGAVNSVNEQGLFPLFAASAYDYSSTAELLIEKGADVNLQNGEGTNALLVAAQMRNLDTMRVLLDRGADPNLANGEGWTPLMIAAQLGFDKGAKLLVERGASLNMTNRLGMTALSVAVETDSFVVARFLAEQAAECVENSNYPYSTAVSSYLVSVYGSAGAGASNRIARYTRASHNLEVAARECEMHLKNKRSDLELSRGRSALGIAGSVVLFVLVGAAPSPYTETTAGIQKDIRASEQCLSRCQELKRQCDEVITCLGSGGETKRACPGEDLTMSFNTKMTDK